MQDCIELRPGERLDDLQRGSLRIIQNERLFRFGTDAVLLSDFAQLKPGANVADLGTDRRDKGFGDPEQLAVTVVESDSKVSCELDMLFLVDSGRNIFRIVEKDVCGHKVRICYETFRESFVKC